MKITADGNHKLPPDEGNRKNVTALKVSGDLGGATAKLTYRTDSGEFIGYIGGALTVPDQLTLKHGAGSAIYVTVNGATGSTNIDVEVNTLA